MTVLIRCETGDNVTVEGPLLDLFSCDFSEEPKTRIALIARPTDRSYVAVRDAGAGGRVGLVGIDLWAAAGVQPRSFSVAGVNFGIVPRTA